MIRYVLAVAVAVTLVGLGAVSIDQAGTERAERQAEQAIEDIETAASELLENENPHPVTEQPPRRSVTVTLPEDGFASTSLETFTLDSKDERTIVRYRADGSTERTKRLEMRLTTPQEDTLTLGGETGPVRLRLTLQNEEGTPVVVESGEF